MNGEMKFFETFFFFFWGGGGSGRGVRLRGGVRADVNGEVKFL